MSPGASNEEVANEIRILLNDGITANGLEVRSEKGILRRSAQRWRTVRLMKLYDPDSGELTKEELRVDSFKVNRAQFPVVQPDPVEKWHCVDGEIDLLREFLNEHRPAGRYRLVDIDGDIIRLIGSLVGETCDQNSLRVVLEQLANHPESVKAIAKSDLATTVFRAAEIERRKEKIASLERAICDPSVNEHALRRELKGCTWIFGGAYVGEALRKELTTQSTLDIPLIRGDGSLHVVEIKQAHISKLVEPYRNWLVVGPGVNQAVGQVQNYLRDLDENRASILAAHKIECRRATATLVIGNSNQVNGASKDQVRETIRTYNSHLSRIVVMTYDELIENALNALNFEPTET